MTGNSVPLHRGLLDDLTVMRIFVAVVEAGSFTGAGHRLRIVPSTVSKRIAALESKIKGQLVIRSTQRLSITELGYRFYERCLSTLQEVEAAETEIGDYSTVPQGLLRVSAPTVFAARHLMPVFWRFLSRFQKIRLDVQLTTVQEDLVARAIDVAIRISHNLDPNLVAVNLAPSYRIYCAAPSYLAREGQPRSITDLAAHNCLTVNTDSHSGWPIRRADGSIDYLQVTGNFVSNNGDMIRQALLAGMGIGHIALFMVHDHLKSGELVELLPEHRLVVNHIFAVFPKRRNLPLKTRAFVDHLRQEIGSTLPWTQPP
jgi:DNA-binding transcriptional LysR family regulator